MNSKSVINKSSKKITKQQASFVDASDADLLNLVLFGITSKAWRETIQH